MNLFRSKKKSAEQKNAAEEQKKASEERQARRRKVSKAVNLMRVRHQCMVRIQNGEEKAKYLLLAVERRLEGFDDDVIVEAEEEYTGKGHAGSARLGRRLQIDAKHLEEKRGGAPEPIVVKVTMAGSNDGMWKTHIDAGRGKDWVKGVGDKSAAPIVYHQVSEDKISIPGPGGAGLLDNVRTAHGMIDGQSNKISNVADSAPEVILDMISERVAGSVRAVEDQEGEGAEERGQVIVVIKAHSRGAVSASRVAAAIGRREPNYKIELVQFDPVPGPGHRDESLKVDVGDDGLKLDESTVLYSIASGYGFGFTPQRVDGAKRIIISRQNHGGGTRNGFLYNGFHYTGASINGLPEGFYVDEEKGAKENGRRIPTLRKIGGKEDVEAALRTMRKRTEANVTDANWKGKDRAAILAEVIEHYWRDHA